MNTTATTTALPEVALARIITRATAVLLGSLAGVGRREITIEGRYTYVWQINGARNALCVVIGTRSGRVIRAGYSVNAHPYVKVFGAGEAAKAAAYWVDFQRNIPAGWL